VVYSIDVVKYTTGTSCKGTK